MHKYITTLILGLFSASLAGAAVTRQPPAQVTPPAFHSGSQDQSGSYLTAPDEMAKKKKKKKKKKSRAS